MRVPWHTSRCLERPLRGARMRSESVTPLLRCSRRRSAICCGLPRRPLSVSRSCWPIEHVMPQNTTPTRGGFTGTAWSVASRGPAPTLGLLRARSLPMSNPAPALARLIEKLKALMRDIGTVRSVADRKCVSDDPMLRRLEQWRGDVASICDDLAALRALPPPAPEPCEHRWDTHAAVSWCKYCGAFRAADGLVRVPRRRHSAAGAAVTLSPPEPERTRTEE